MIAKAHIDVLVNAAIRYELLAVTDADATGTMLWSVDGTTRAYTFTLVEDNDFEPLALIKLIDGYEDCATVIYDPDKGFVRVSINPAAHQWCADLRTAVERTLPGHAVQHQEYEGHVIPSYRLDPDYTVARDIIDDIEEVPVRWD